MRATGIVRRIDDLGRIVIPKEIRKTLKIHEGSPLEIYTDNTGNVIFKKYSPVGEMANLAQIYSFALSNSLNCACIITDNDKIIAVEGCSKRDLVGKNISEKLSHFTTQKKIGTTDEPFPISDGYEKFADLTSLIYSEGDVIGTIILAGLSREKNVQAKESVKLLSLLIGKQTE